LGIQHEYLEIIRIGIRPFFATEKKSEKGRFPLEPQVRRNPFKNV
jgi:hypothetical protein